MVVALLQSELPEIVACELRLLCWEMFDDLTGLNLRKHVVNLWKRRGEVGLEGYAGTRSADALYS